MDKIINTIFSDKKVVVITGAGISTLSGLCDFRGNNGLYKRHKNLEWKLSIDCLVEEPDEFYNFYKNNLLMLNVEPNVIHETLFRLEEKGYIDYIITQNIDGLHQKVGSKNVIELHGNGERFYCTKCKEEYDINDYQKGYVCDKCNGLIRPDIVLYGEKVKTKDNVLAKEKMLQADVVLVLGSSLMVSTIRSLLNEYIKSKKVETNPEQLIIINDDITIYDQVGLKYTNELESVFRRIRKHQN